MSQHKSPLTSNPRPEILAPAGSQESFFAALESGADAVYTGLREFSARARAKNVSLADLEKMLAYARGLGRRLYVTVNTLVKEGELPALAECLAALEAMRVDGVILQDPAVWRLARRHFPGLPLHASTQMTVHNAAGVKTLEKLGFSRVVLARELSLDEIAAIRSQTTLELEHFIHGALCFSFSGQCYFSSWLGGKSGNRGRCAQPCRRRFRYRGREGYYFSTNDLSAIDLLPELAAAGVCSFKIEGRMKSAEYVANVVGAYRLALDAPVGRRQEAVREGKERLKRSFGRRPTRGFLPGGIPSDIAIASQKGATGRLLGELTAVSGGDLTFRCRELLNLGDRLRIQPRSDKSGTAFTVRALRLGRRPARSAPAGSMVTVPSPFKGTFRVGDSVFKVASEQAFTLSEAAGRRRLEKIVPPPEPVRLQLRLEQGALAVRGETAGITFERSYEVSQFPAASSPLSIDTLKAVFVRTGNDPFALESLEAEDLPSVVIPPSRLKEIRREFYRELRLTLERERQTQRKAHLQAALADLLPKGAQPAGGSSEITVAIPGLRDLNLINAPEIDRLLVPLTPGMATHFEGLARRLRGRERQIVWDLPFILFDAVWPEYRRTVQSLVQRGFTVFRLNNLGHFPLFEGLDGVTLVAGYRLFSLNSQAVLAWQELGIAETTLYLEDDRENMRELLSRNTGIPAAAVLYGPVPLITSRIPLRGLRSDAPLLSDRGEAYRVDARSGLTVLTPETDYSLLGRQGELQAMGCGKFLIDLTHLGPFSPQGKRVMESLRRGQPVSGTSSFNFERGWE